MSQLCMHDTTLTFTCPSAHLSPVISAWTALYRLISRHHQETSDVHDTDAVGSSGKEGGAEARGALTLTSGFAYTRHDETTRRV